MMRFLAVQSTISCVLLGSLLMGVKPDDVPNEHDCPLHCWYPYYQPDKILVSVSGALLGDAAPPSAKAPPNGIGLFQFINCGYYEGSVDGWDGGIVVHSDHVHLYLDSSPGITVYMCDVYAPLPEKASRQLESISTWYQDARTEMMLHGDGDHPPLIWQIGDFLGVPLQPGYFAEEFPSVIGARYCRYSAHFNGSDLKVITDF